MPLVIKITLIGAVAAINAGKSVCCASPTNHCTICPPSVLSIDCRNVVNPAGSNPKIAKNANATMPMHSTTSIRLKARCRPKAASGSDFVAMRHGSMQREKL